jgi:DNA polymerase-3 subunit beta
MLANVLIRKTGSLQLTTSDLEIQIRTTAELDGDTAARLQHHGGRAQADRHPAHHARTSTVSLESTQAKLILKGGKSKFTLQTLPCRKTFPLVQEAPASAPSSACRKRRSKTCWVRFRLPWRCTTFATTSTASCSWPRASNSALVATDGHRLAFASATLDVEVPKQEVILPRKTVIELQRLLLRAERRGRP